MDGGGVGCVVARTGKKRSLGFITNGQDGSQGTVVDINVTTTDVPFKITLYMLSDVKPNASATWSFSSQAIRGAAHTHTHSLSLTKAQHTHAYSQKHAASVYHCDAIYLSESPTHDGITMTMWCALLWDVVCSDGSRDAGPDRA
jgi:hypothetical protein